MVPSHLAEARAGSSLTLPADARLADATQDEAAAFGVTAELATTTDYALTQLWAAALRTAGFDGIHYWARRDLEHDHACLALFGDAGEHTNLLASKPLSVVEQPRSLADLRESTGISVLSVPPRGC